jgi:hypothetical protein
MNTMLAWGAILSSEGVTPFSGCSEPLLPSPDALFLVSQGIGPRLPLECVAAIPCIFEND